MDNTVLYHGRELYDNLRKDEIHGFKEINFGKNKMLPLKTTHWKVEFP